MINRNLSNSATHVFKILNKLLLSDCDRSIFEQDFSKDSFLIYVSTLRKAGFYIEKHNKTFTYSLKSNINMLNLDNEDIEILTEIKKIFMQSNNYMNVIHYNNFLKKFLKYTDNTTQKKLVNIIENIPLGLSEHEFIFSLQNFINNKIPLKIKYNSNLKEKTYKLFPVFLKTDNSKIYLWGVDNSIEGLRCLKIDRIKKITESKEQFKTIKEDNFAVCEFYNRSYLKVFNEDNIKLLDKNKDTDKVKIYFSNKFDFFQKILNLGVTSKIIEPRELRSELSTIISNIGKIYE